MSFEGIDFNDDTASEAIKSLVDGMKSLKDVCHDLAGMLCNGLFELHGLLISNCEVLLLF